MPQSNEGSDWSGEKDEEIVRTQAKFGQTRRKSSRESPKTRKVRTDCEKKQPR
jgi:hypothetical protein